LDTASGFGLGLSIVLAIVEAHEGRFAMSNRTPRGLCARIDLPLAAAKLEARQPAADLPIASRAA
ncbi:hypothetical protein ABTH17_19115, partial [Acinetobacter baumannii]